MDVIRARRECAEQDPVPPSKAVGGRPPTVTWRVAPVKSMTTAARDHLNGAVAGSAVMSSAGSRTTASSRKEHPAMATPGTVRAAVIRAVTYRRVSTFGQLGGTSPETQLERALAI